MKTNKNNLLAGIHKLSPKGLKQLVGFSRYQSNDKQNFDNKHQKRYNCAYEINAFHLYSFGGINFNCRGFRPAADTLSTIISHFKNYLLKPLLFISLTFFGTLKLQAQSTEDFFYQRGYEQGYNAGFEVGVAEAFKEAKAMLSKYGDSLKSYEIGKYLVRNQNLTYPQVWQEKDSKGGFKLRIVPSEIQRELNVEELFSKFAEIPSINASIEDKLELSLAQKNSVYLNNRDSNVNALPQSVNQSTNKHTLFIKKNAKNLEILKRANVVFSDEGNSYNVLFFTQTEKQNFCNQFEICK